MNDQRILDRYRLVERLAAGGSAEVWRAVDEQLDRQVAIKRLHPHLFADEASRSRLAAEARAAARLSHPVIVGVYDVDASGDAPALVMELVNGESLATRLAREGPLRERAAAALAADLAEALFHAHQQGVIHRDIKPGNVLLDADGRTRLVDFGIAHSLADASERLTVTGTVVGTLRAMAPEQLADGPITPRTDLYGLGVVLHETLTGRPPYPTGSPLALAAAQQSGPPALPGVDPALAAVVARCLAYDPADRPLHAGAVAQALRSWLAGDAAAALALAPVPAVDTDAVTQPVPVTPPPAPPPTPARPATPRPASSGRRPIRLLPILAGVAALLVVAVLAAFATGRPDATADTTPSASPPSAAPTASPPPPEWLAGLVDKVEKECGVDAATAAESEMAAMTEDEAKEYADARVKECKDDGGGGGGNGNGRGGGNGNGNGRGNDD